MTTLSLAQTHAYALPRRRGIFGRAHLIAWNILILVGVLTFGVAYLVEVNKTMSVSYEMSDAQKRVEVAAAAVRANQIKLSELGTVERLTAQAAAMGMVPTASIEYVSVPNSGVAMR